MFKFIFTAAMAASAFAYTQPTGDSPVGNPIAEPGLASVVPAGENFTITWQPTTQGTVTLVLLKGPSSNAVPQYAIVEKIPNSGSYVWQVASDLQPTENAQGYGIQLIVDATGQYQYTTQFGISNPNYKAVTSSASAATATATTWTTYCPYETTFTAGSKTYSVTKATTLTITETCSSSSAKATGPVTASHSTGASTGFITTKPANVTMVAPTGGYTQTTVATTYSKPLTPSASASATPTSYKGAASNVAASFFGLAAAAGLVLMAM